MIVDHLFQHADAVGAGGDHRYYRAAEARRQRGDVDIDMLAFGDVEHVQRHDAGDAQLQQLQRQVEVALQVGGVDHVDQQIGVAAQNVVAGDLLIERGLLRDGGEGVGAGQIDQPHVGLRGGEMAFFAFDRHARPVADPLACAGQLVEQRGFAGVRVTD